jgi:hypothetical protein
VLPRRLQRLADEAVVTEDAPHLRSRAGATAAPRTTVDLAGRATSVPFTAVATGLQQTLTDKTTTAATCGDHHIPS